MNALVVDDDFASRMVIQRYLLSFGSTDVATDGVEAVTLFKAALEKKQHYDLVCLDIMLSRKSGQAVLKEVRQLEADYGIPEGKRAGSSWSPRSATAKPCWKPSSGVMHIS